MNISVYARMPILGMNTDEVRHEQGMNDVKYSQKLQVKNDAAPLVFTLYSAVKRRQK